MTLIIGLYGGPGTGKSTTAALLFGRLKQRGVNAELVTEFAKELVWEGRHSTLLNQVYILGKQAHRIERLIGKVDIIVTDSPIMLPAVYSKGWSELEALAKSIHDKWDTLDIFITRDSEFHPYNPKGRTQDEEEALLVDQEITKMLDKHEIYYHNLHMTPNIIHDIENILNFLGVLR